MELVCETEKKCFRTKDEAKQLAIAIQGRKKQKDHIEAYICEHCHCWHLTSQTTQKFKQKRKRLASENKGNRSHNLKPYMFNRSGNSKKKRKKNG